MVGSGGDGERLLPWQGRFVDQAGLHADVALPRTLGRVLAWLVVCQPRYQSAEQLSLTLRLSSGSVSGATTGLVRAGLAVRRSFPGDRRIYYELHADAWQRLLALRLRALGDMREVAEAAWSESGGVGDERLARMREFYGAYQAVLSQLMETAPREPKRRKGSKKLSKPRTRA